MASSKEIRRGNSCLSLGVDSDILLGPTITSVNLLAELTLYPHVKPGTIAWNRKWYYDPSAEGAIHVFLDVDGQWYNSTGTEVM